MPSSQAIFGHNPVRTETGLRLLLIRRFWVQVPGGVPLEIPVLATILPVLGFRRLRPKQLHVHIRVRPAGCSSWPERRFRGPIGREPARPRTATRLSRGEGYRPAAWISRLTAMAAVGITDLSSLTRLLRASSEETAVTVEPPEMVMPALEKTAASSSFRIAGVRPKHLSNAD